jgi:hypothetical protein
MKDMTEFNVILGIKILRNDKCITLYSHIMCIKYLKGLSILICHLCLHCMTQSCTYLKIMVIVFHK